MELMRVEEVVVRVHLLKPAAGEELQVFVVLAAPLTVQVKAVVLMVVQEVVEPVLLLQPAAGEELQVFVVNLH